MQEVLMLLTQSSSKITLVVPCMLICPAHASLIHETTIESESLLAQPSLALQYKQTVFRYRGIGTMP